MITDFSDSLIDYRDDDFIMSIILITKITVQTNGSNSYTRLTTYYLYLSITAASLPNGNGL